VFVCIVGLMAEWMVAVTILARYTFQSRPRPEVPDAFQVSVSGLRLVLSALTLSLIDFRFSWSKLSLHPPPGATL